MHKRMFLRVYVSASPYVEKTKQKTLQRSAIIIMIMFPLVLIWSEAGGFSSDWFFFSYVAPVGRN